MQYFICDEDFAMTTEIYWLVLTIVVTAIFWMPYVLHRIAVRGLLRVIGNLQASDKPHSPWAERALLVHQNAVKNLIIFASTHSCSPRSRGF